MAGKGSGVTDVMNKICDAATAATMVRDGQSVASTGILGWLTPDVVLEAIGERFEATGSPAGLTFYFPCVTGDNLGIGGMDHVAKKGLMRRVVAGSFTNLRNPVSGERPAMMELIRNDLVEAYCWPIAATMHWLREVARRGPGYLTRVGLGTYIDPRHGGGKFTRLAQDDLVELVDFRGEQYLFYPSWPLDVGIIRASSADPAGNLSFEDQPLVSCALSMALAVKASGGTVIAQVAQVVRRGSRTAREVHIPGTLVDHVVVAPDAPVGTDVQDDLGFLRVMPNLPRWLPRLPTGAAKVIARRAAQEIRPGETSILGFGGSSQAVLAMAEDGAFDGGRIFDYAFTTEHGSHGGAVMAGLQFAANYGPEALLDGPSQFDLIDGGGCPFALLAFAELDADGNVNVSRFGPATPGGGGFTSIAAAARRLVLAGTLTTGGLTVDYRDGGLHILREGAIKKFVPAVDAITYAARNGVHNGQTVRIVTERAVFELTTDGLTLIEIAPGIDLRRDILPQLGFPITVADPLPTMDQAHFRP